MPFIDGNFVWANNLKPKLKSRNEVKCKGSDFNLSGKIASLPLVFGDRAQEETIYSDLTVEVEGIKYNVHRNILAGRSHIFKVMLENDFSESSTGYLKITDFDERVVKAVFLYIYGYKPRFKWDFGSIQNIADVLRAADLYELPGLKVICENLLIARLNRFKKIAVSTDFCEILTIAYAMQTPRLMLELAFMYCRFCNITVEFENLVQRADNVTTNVKRNLTELKNMYITSDTDWRTIHRDGDKEWHELDEFSNLKHYDMTSWTFRGHGPWTEDIPMTESLLSDLRMSERVTAENKLIADVSIC